MRDGTYRIRHRQEVKVVQVERNQTHLGSVHHLESKGWNFEEVMVMNQQELERVKRGELNPLLLS